MLRAPTLPTNPGLWPTLVLATLLAGCRGEEPGARWTTTVDTLPGGVRHVVNRPPSDPAPTWTIQEEIRIGTVEGAGATTFAQIKGMAVLEDGRIAALDAQAQELRLFSPDGGHLATYGGKGQGPGELTGAHGLMLGPDGSLWVPDVRNARMSVFDPDSGFRESFPLELLSWGFIWRGAMAEDGRILKPSVTRATPRRNVLRVFSAGLELVDSLPLPDNPDVDPRDPPGSFYWESSDGGTRGYMGVPFFQQGVRLLDPRGDIWTVPYGESSYRIARWMPGGDTTLVLETARPPVPVTEADRDSAVDRLREYLEGRSAGRQDWSKIPQVRPAVLSMFLADEGRLWVETSRADTLRAFDVYERDGRYVGTAVTALDIYSQVLPVVRGDRFWAVVTDELDVPYLVRGRLVPFTAQSSPG